LGVIEALKTKQKASIIIMPFLYEYLLCFFGDINLYIKYLISKKKL